MANNLVVPLPVKMLRNWVLSGSYAITGSTFAKLFRRSPFLAARSFDAIADEVSFLQDRDIIVAHPDFQAFLSGYRQQTKRLSQMSSIGECFFFGSYYSVARPVGVDQLDYWQQIRYLVKEMKPENRALPLLCDAEILPWPKNAVWRLPSSQES